MGVPYQRLRTIGNQEAVVFTRDAGGEYPLLGAIYNGERWLMKAWTNEGKAFIDVEHDLDLDLRGDKDE